MSRSAQHLGNMRSNERKTVSPRSQASKRLFNTTMDRRRQLAANAAEARESRKNRHMMTTEDEQFPVSRRKKARNTPKIAENSESLCQDRIYRVRDEDIDDDIDDNISSESRTRALEITNFGPWKWAQIYRLSAYAVGMR